MRVLPILLKIRQIFEQIQEKTGDSPYLTGASSYKINSTMKSLALVCGPGHPPQADNAMTTPSSLGWIVNLTGKNFSIICTLVRACSVSSAAQY